MIDTHAHIDGKEYFEDLNEVCTEAFADGLEAIIIPAIGPKDFKRVLNTTVVSPKIFAAIGIHPHNANEANEENLALVEELSRNNPKVVAIGETGLDYFYNFASHETQIQSFEHHIEIAKKLNLPLIIHNREAEKDMIQILEQNNDGNLKGVMHCFSGDMDFLKRIIDCGLYVSFTGNITFKKIDMDEIVRAVPNDRIMLETDSPYMTPVPNRGKRNKPSNVRFVAEKIAEIKSISINEVNKMTTENAKRLFKLILLLALMLLPMFSYAQDDRNTENDEAYADSLDQEHYNPYKKTFGIDLVLATNTIVQTFYPEEDERSAEGVLSLGGGLEYFLNDYVMLQGAYIYSKDTKYMKDSRAIVVRDPNYHHVLELSAKIVATPWQRLNFYAIIGGQALYNKYSMGFGEFETFTKYGINGGLGVLANFKAGKAGLLTVSAEWKVDFILGKSRLTYDYRFDQSNPKYDDGVDVTWFYSIPRVIIAWYPWSKSK
ncbi:MAG: TatD family hydrolase [bacterium]